MHQALYRKYRPAVFDDVCGQEHITDVLHQQVRTGSVSHAYLFCGSRGTGKTTCAKILAKAVNCTSPVDGNPCCKCEMCRAIDAGLCLDVVEMDAASNTGVDYIREIKEEVAYSSTSAKSRVYILDEVHMLSESAFNALLKTLEEPPENVIFILATTELSKIPATVLSRCLRFDFRRITVGKITERLRYIAGREGFEADDDALELIAVLARGGMRDAVGMLELASGRGGRIDVACVRDVVGIAGSDDVYGVFSALAQRDCLSIFKLIDKLYRSSKDLADFAERALTYCRDMLLLRIGGDGAGRELFEMTAEEFDGVKALAGQFSSEKLLYYIDVLERTLVTMNRVKLSKKLLCELAFIEMATPTLNDTPKALLARVSDLETGLSDSPSVHNTARERADDSASAEKKEQARTDSSVKPKTAERQTAEERPFAPFNEITEKYASRDRGTATFLQRSQAFTDGSGSIIITVPDSFSELMINKDEVKENILGLAKAYDSSLDKVKVRVKKKVEKRDDFDGMDIFLNDNSEEIQ